jgi:hypothetical protein
MSRNFVETIFLCPSHVCERSFDPGKFRVKYTLDPEKLRVKDQLELQLK